MNPSLPGPVSTDRHEGWRWWEARRLRYNIGLVVVGWTAYALFLLLQYTGAPQLEISWQALGPMTIFLGIGYLLLMALANLLYLLGVVLERFIQPDDIAFYRERAWALGFWGSIALPFLFPLGTYAVLLASSGSP